LIGSESDKTAIQRLVVRLMESKLGPDVRIRAVLGLGRGLRRSGGSLSQALAGAGSKHRDSLFAEAARMATSDGPPEQRQPAIALLGMGKPEAALKLLPELLDSRQPVQVQLAALQSLGGLSDSSIGEIVVGRWRAMSPSVRREAAEVLFGRRQRIESLLQALEARRLTSGEIDPDRIKQLRGHRDPELKGRAVKILGTEAETARERQATIEVLRRALTLDGQTEHGRAIFIKSCATCHRAAGQGVDVGPDLATVTGRSPEDLLVHILDPNREVAPNFVNYSVATVEGRIITGIIASETATALTLKRAEAASDVIPRSQIEEVASTGMSLMPEGLEKGLTAQDFADLIAFVKAIQINAGLGAVPQGR
jgi:putative heme-binding domain-containing protein